MSDEFGQVANGDDLGESNEQKYFTIAQASDLLGVKPHVLRYWESEFPQIRPIKTKNGQRLYRRRDFETLKHLQRLLFQERCTIASARQSIRKLWEKELREEKPRNEKSLLMDDCSLAVESGNTAALDVAHGPVGLVKQTAEHRMAPTDVLAIVEEKVTRSEMRERLLCAEVELKDMLLILGR